MLKITTMKKMKLQEIGNFTWIIAYPVNLRCRMELPFFTFVQNQMPMDVHVSCQHKILELVWKTALDTRELFPDKFYQKYIIRCVLRTEIDYNFYIKKNIKKVVSCNPNTNQCSTRAKYVITQIITNNQ